MAELPESGPDVYTLVDENGIEANYELLDIIEVDGQLYFALIPHVEASDISSDRLEILKRTMINGEEMLASIEDNAEFVRISQMVLDRIDEDLNQ